MLFGYCRVSTEAQSLNKQIDGIINFGVEKENIFLEKMSGTKKNRPELNKLIAKLRKNEGDVIVVERLSRLGRSARDLLELCKTFDEMGVTLKSLKESIDTSTDVGKLMLGILSTLAEFERNLIVSRTQEGLASARARGRVGGRPKCNPKKLDQAVKLHAANAHSIREICVITGISQTSLYRELNRLKKEARNK